jgi:hypothetical protein
MLKHRLGKILLLILLWQALYCPKAFAQAQPVTDFTNQMQVDYHALAGFANAQFTKSFGFLTSLGWNTPPSVFDILSGPRVEVGVGAGADIVGVGSFQNLPLQALVASANLSIPSVVPIPFPVATARVGLFHGMDIGFRLSTIPQVNLSDLGFAANFLGWGLDFRYKIFDDLKLPTVTVGASFDTMKGNITLTTGVNQSSTYYDPNTATTYNDTITGNSSYALDWNLNSFGAHLMFGKDLGMIYPFAGIGFQRNSGSINSTVSGTMTGTVTQTNGTPVGSQNVSVQVTSAGAPFLFEPKYIVGFDLGEGFHWAVVGESNGTDIAGSTSFRVQF